MSTRTILRLGHPILRQVARPVTEAELPSPEVQALIDDMVETMRAADGAGLAAPQVGESLRICVIELEANPRYPELDPISLSIWINPEVTVLPGGPTIHLFEGCLSVPGIRGRVSRPGHIRVTALDRTGAPLELEFTGPLASVIQHEVDHLDGKLFIDRAAVTTLAFTEELPEFLDPKERLVVEG